MIVLVDSLLFTAIGLLALIAIPPFALSWLASWSLVSAPAVPEAPCKPASSEGVIRITRRQEHRDFLRAYKVLLDGRLVANIWVGQAVEVDAPPGSHTLALKLDWGRSNIVQFQMDGGSIDFECGSSLRGVRIVLAPLYATLLFNRLIWLRKISG